MRRSSVDVCHFWSNSGLGRECKLELQMVSQHLADLPATTFFEFGVRDGSSAAEASQSSCSPLWKLAPVSQRISYGFPLLGRKSCRTNKKKLVPMLHKRSTCKHLVVRHLKVFWTEQSITGQSNQFWWTKRAIGRCVVQQLVGLPYREW